MNTEEKEDLRHAAQILMENRWVTRKDSPADYLLVRRYEKPLRQFFRDNCGWPLLVTAQFYKLEKIPGKARAFMGLTNMQSREDYALLCCVMAFLEEYETGGQFLLGDLVEALPSYYPEETATSKLEWENYSWRKALIRVIDLLSEEGLLKIVDDESDTFLTGYKDGVMSGEALYEVTSLSRYFLRTFPKELMEYGSIEELERADFRAEATEEARTQRRRRQRIHRELFLSPVYYWTEEAELDFAYLRNQRNRLADNLEDWLDLHLELYRNAVMTVSYAQNAWFGDVFPIRFKGLHDIILHLSHYLRESEKSRPGQLSRNEWESCLKKLRNAVGSGWTKEYREMKLEKLADTVLDEMQAWGMARAEHDGLIALLPALYRNAGTYPNDYKTENKGENA